MILWLYGLAFSLSFWFLVLDYSLITELLPLLITVCVALLYTMKLLRHKENASFHVGTLATACLLYTSPSPRDVEDSREPSSAG